MCDLLKKIFMTMVVVLVCSVCLLTACGTSALDNNPAKELEAFGNGGLAVVKGEYLYYVNGYQDYKEFSDVRKDNKFGDIVRGGIYRTKLVNGMVVRDENGFLVDTECVVSHTVGFDKGGFYIVGDYIYYLTPHMENAKDETTNEKVLKSDWVDICRININGKDKTRLAYTTEDARINDWAVYTIDNKAYIVVHDGTKIISIDGENGKEVEMATGVASVKLFKQENYTYGADNLDDSKKYVYYTREYTEDDCEYGKSGNKLCKVEIGKSEEVVVACDLTHEFELLDVANGRIYYTKLNKTTNGTWKKEVYRRSMNGTGSEEYVCSEFSTYVFLDNGDESSLMNNAIVVNSNNVVFLVSNGVMSEPLYTAGATIQVIGVDDAKFYFVEGSAIKCLDLMTNETPIVVSNASKTYILDNSNMIDLDGRRIFVMAEYTAEDGTKHSYLNVIDRYDSESESEFVGKFADGETPKEPTVEESEDEDEELEKELWIK